jgi:hypothetical protein
MNPISQNENIESSQELKLVQWESLDRTIMCIGRRRENNIELTIIKAQGC